VRGPYVANDGFAALIAEAHVVRLDDGFAYVIGPGRSRGRCRESAVRYVARQPDARGPHRIGGSCQYIGRRPDIDRPAIGAERQDDVGQRPRSVDAVLDQDLCRRSCAADRPERDHQTRGGIGIQVRRRFVEHQQSGSWREGPGERQPLLLPARELPRTSTLHPFQPDLGEGLRHAVVHRIPLPAAVLEAERDVVLDPFHDELRRWILEEQAHARRDADRPEREGVVLVEVDRALDGGWDLERDQTRDRECERALAGPGRPDDQEDGAGLDVEVDARDSRKVGPGIGDREIPDPERDRGQSGNPSRTPARLRARWRATEPPATITTAEIAIAMPRMIWISGSTVA